jgi:pimeloyl-ACP methyl ester carboxylesterase
MKSIINTVVKSKLHTKPIVTDVYFNQNNTKKTVVIFCHGYKGYKDWGAWNLTAPKFVESNLFFVKFNFSHNGGTVENAIDFPDLNAFGENNFTIELNDLEDVINWICTNESFENEIDVKNIILIGHSRGGGIVSIKASENSKISKVITWSSVSDFGARFPTGNLLETWRKDGISYVENSRTKQKMPHYFQFYTNFKENEARLTIKNAISKLTIPHLIIHGSNDDVVLPNEAENLHSWNPNSELLLIKDMNHSLGNIQPWNSKIMPNYLEKVVAKTIEFILRK